MKKEAKKFFVLFFLGILFVSIIGGVFVSADSHPDNPINQGTWYADLFNFLNLGETWQALILSIVVLMIVYAGLYDLLQLISIFDSQWVKTIIAGGLAIAAALTGGILSTAGWLIQIAAGIGVFGIIIEIIVALGVFMGLSIASSRIALFAAKRKGLKSLVQGKKFAGNLEALKEVAAVAGTPKQKGFFKKLGGNN